MADTATETGLMLKDNQGNVYYIRPEILEAAMVPKDMAEKALKEVKKEGKAGRKSYDVLGSVEAKGGAKLEMARSSSTIMCPW